MVSCRVLPKTDFLTKIDELIVLTVVTVVMSGLWSIPVYLLVLGGKHRRRPVVQ